MSSESSAREGDGFWRFVVVGLLLSLCLHGALFYWAGRWVPPRFGEAYYEQIVPRKFRLERVEIDPRLLEEEPEAPSTAQQPIEVKPVDLPPETVSLQNPSEHTEQPEAVRAADLLSEEKIEPGTGLAAALQAAPGAGLLAENLEALKQELLEQNAASPARPVLDLPEGLAGGGAPAGVSLRTGPLPGYSDLDELLSRTGPIDAGEDPIFMPGDLLFEYDSAEVRPEAEEVLRKLGTLIQRHPDLRFRIEGHTDSFGPAEYNQGLSERRALAVKEWLMREMGIAPERMTTVGYGSTRLVVPATESIEGQRFNRRVEIVIEGAPGSGG